MTAKEQLKELRREMRKLGIKKTSPFNGGMDMVTYRYNARRFELETRAKDEEKQRGTKNGNSI